MTIHLDRLLLVLILLWGPFAFGLPLLYIVVTLYDVWQKAMHRRV